MLQDKNQELMRQSRIREVMASPGWEYLIKSVYEMMEKAKESTLLATFDPKKTEQEIRIESGRYEGIKSVLEYFEKMKNDARDHAK